tara:strand:+ start:6112 stop:7035 length:924 start_codon:yes stop_codon:yes gene_type:complete
MQSDIEYLKNLSFFEGFTNSELEQLLELNRIDRYNKGEHILKENEVDENNEGFYFVILRGSVDIIKQKKKLSTLEIGDCFGELAYLINQKRTADVIAVSDETLVMEINGKKIDCIKTSDMRNKLIRRIAITLAQKLTNASRLIANDLVYPNDTEEDTFNEDSNHDLNVFQFLSRTRLLKTTSFFAPFSSNQIGEILTLPHSFINVKDNQRIENNEESNGKFHIFYILLKGTVKVMKQGNTVSTLSQGDCFTQKAKLNAAKKQKADLIAEKGSKIFAINLGIFEKASKEMQLLFYKQFGRHQAIRLAS